MPSSISIRCCRSKGFVLVGVFFLVMVLGTTSIQGADKLVVKNPSADDVFKVGDDGVAQVLLNGTPIPALFDASAAYRFAVEDNYSGLQGVAAGSQVWNKFYLFGDRARGTISVPLAPEVNDGVFEFLGRVYDGNSMEATAGVSFLVDGTVSDEVAPQRIEFLTGEAATRITRMTIRSDGHIGIGTETPNSALQVLGYVQLDITSGSPVNTDCDETDEAGRMKVDPATSTLWICMGTNGWVGK